MTVDIPDSVTEIGDYTFENCSSFVSIDIPDSVTTIGRYAFYGCNTLVSVDIPDSVTKIGQSAFAGCSALVTVDIPDSVAKIKEHTFDGCISLVSIDISDSVTIIENYAFYKCISLVSVEIPNSVTKIENYAFDRCENLRRIVFEDGESTLECGYSLSFKEYPVEELYLGREFSNRISPFKDNTNIVILSLGRFTKNAKSIFPESNENLRFINCYNPIPPEVNNFTKMQYVNIIVNIPTGSFKAYKSHSVWGLLGDLEEPYIESDLEIKAQDIILNIEEVELYAGRDNSTSSFGFAG